MVRFDKLSHQPQFAKTHQLKRAKGITKTKQRLQT